MTLRDLHNVLGSGEPIRIATENGEGWLVDTTVIHLDEWERLADFYERKIVNIYTSDGRQSVHFPKVKPLCPAICILVEGIENGTI